MTVHGQVAALTLASRHLALGLALQRRDLSAANAVVCKQRTLTLARTAGTEVSAAGATVRV
jgi:hypothetical protein